MQRARGVEFYGKKARYADRSKNRWRWPCREGMIYDYSK
jgi:hypothetical protein